MIGDMKILVGEEVMMLIPAIDTARVSCRKVNPRRTCIIVKQGTGMLKVSPSASQEVHRSLLLLQVIG